MQPATNLAPGGMGTALSHRPLAGGMSAMQGKPMLPGVQGPNGLFGRPGPSIGGLAGVGIPRATAATKVARLIANHEKRAAGPYWPGVVSPEQVGTLDKLDTPDPWPEFHRRYMEHPWRYRPGEIDERPPDLLAADDRYIDRLSNEAHTNSGPPPADRLYRIDTSAPGPYADKPRPGGWQGSSPLLPAAVGGLGGAALGGLLDRKHRLRGALIGGGLGLGAGLLGHYASGMKTAGFNANHEKQATDELAAANPLMSMIGRAGRINARVGGAGRELRGIGSVAMPASQAYRAYNTATTSPWVPGGTALAGAGLGALMAGRKRRLLGGLIGGGLGLGAGILGQQALQHAPGMLMRYAGGTKAASFRKQARDPRIPYYVQPGSPDEGVYQGYLNRQDAWYAKSGWFDRLTGNHSPLPPGYHAALGSSAGPALSPPAQRASTAMGQVNKLTPYAGLAGALAGPEVAAGAAARGVPATIAEGAGNAVTRGAGSGLSTAASYLTGRSAPAPSPAVPALSDKAGQVKQAMDDYYACGGDPGCIERARRGRDERARSREVSTAGPGAQRLPQRRASPGRSDLLLEGPPVVSAAGRRPGAGGAGSRAGTQSIPVRPDLSKQAADKAEKGPDGQPKASQEQAHYGPSFSAARSCAMCANFDGQGKCAVVAGPIQPTGTSDMFTPRPEMAALGPTSSMMPAMGPEGTKLGASRKKLHPWMPAKGRFRRKKADSEKDAVAPIGLPLAMLAGMLGGGVAGHRLAPKGHKSEGVIRGASRGRGAALLGVPGALAGGLAGAGLGSALGIPDVGVATGGLAGAGLGGYAGNALAGWMLGKPSWQRKGEKYHPSGMKHPRQLRAALAASPLAVAAGLGGGGLYARHAVGPLSGGGAGHSTDARAAQEIVDKVLGGGKARVLPSPGLGNAAAVDPEKIRQAVDSFGTEDPDYDTLSDMARKGQGGVIWDDEAGFGRGVAAHEAGHLLNHASHGRFSDLAQGFSETTRTPALLSAIAAPLLSNRKWARRLALAGTATQAPELIDEILASHRGGMGLAGGHPGLEGVGEYLRAYSGVPTYALGTALPLLAYGAAKALGRWGPDKPVRSGSHDGRAGRDADHDGRLHEGRRKAAAQEKCGCSGNTLCGSCAAKARKKYKEVRPERREGAARFAWRGRGAKDVTDDPGYEKYTRKAASAALDLVLARTQM